MAIAGATMKVAGSIQEGNARADQLNQQGAVSDYNAQIAEQNAVIAWQQGTAREAQVRNRARQILGSQAANLAESGLDSGSGSALAMAKQSATNAELDSLNTLYGADLRARGYKMQAENEKYQGNLSHAGAGSARAMGYWAAAGAVVNSAASYYGGGGGGGGPIVGSSTSGGNAGGLGYP
jgi:hypothetical protein